MLIISQVIDSRRASSKNTSRSGLLQNKLDKSKPKNLVRKQLWPKN